MIGDRYEDTGIYRADRKGFRPVREAEFDSSDFQRALGVPEQCIIHNAVYVLRNMAWSTHKFICIIVLRIQLHLCRNVS